MVDERLKVNSPEWWNNCVPNYMEKQDMRERPNEFLALSECIKSGPVLEVGPAFGMFSRYIPSIQYMGLDICPDLIVQARRMNPEKIFVCDDVRNFGEHQWSKSFHHSVVMQTLEHFSRPDFVKIMNKLKMITRKSLIFSVPLGLPTEADAIADGHLIGWETAGDLILDFKNWGTVSLIDGDANHICGEIHYA